MEQRFGTNRIDLEVLCDFCEQEGQCVVYRKGEQMEREGDPSRWFGFVAEGCFGAHHMVLVRGRVRDRLSQLS